MLNYFLYILILPLFGSFIILFFNNNKIIKKISILISFLIFISLSFIWISFDKQTTDFQLLQTIDWINFYNINLIIGIDGISILFIMLTALLIPVCMVSSYYSIQKY